jgi:hypothetical protein
MNAKRRDPLYLRETAKRRYHKKKKEKIHKDISISHLKPSISSWEFPSVYLDVHELLFNSLSLISSWELSNSSSPTNSILKDFNTEGEGVEEGVADNLITVNKSKERN